MLDIPEKSRSIINEILRTHAPGCEVRAYGSRTSGMAHAGSDLDLVVIGNIDGKQLAKLKGAFEESDLPMSVDILDWNVLPEDFKRSIGKKYEVVQKAR
jgi:predicted nucleotidyltransferase